MSYNKINDLFGSIYRIYIVLICLLFFAHHASAQRFDASYICKRVAKIAVPSTDGLLTDEDLKYLDGCYAYKWYYGRDYRNVDYKKALYCASKNKDYKILSLIYANGAQVKRNFDLAIHFACLLPSAEPERNKFIILLLHYAHSKNFLQDFNGCDAEQDEARANICWGYELERLQDNIRGSRWPSPSSFSSNKGWFIYRLIERYYEYVDNRAYFELYNNNIKSMKHMLFEELKLLKEHIALYKQIKDCSLPLYTEDDYKKADVRLNAVYKTLRTDPSLFKQLNAEDKVEKLKQIAKTEYIWIIYKEGMLKVSQLMCPSVSKYSVATILTKQRTKQLEELPPLFN